MKANELARRIEETPIGPFSILLGLGEEHFKDLVAARALIVKAVNSHEVLVKALEKIAYHEPTMSDFPHDVQGMQMLAFSALTDDVSTPEEKSNG